jgi:hypothetical protein
VVGTDRLFHPVDVASQGVLPKRPTVAHQPVLHSGDRQSWTEARHDNGVVSRHSTFNQLPVGDVNDQDPNPSANENRRALLSAWLFLLFFAGPIDVKGQSLIGQCCALPKLLQSLARSLLGRAIWSGVAA